jgi:hypothetical protein
MDMKIELARRFAITVAVLINAGWSLQAAAQAPSRPVQTQQNCTRAAPCTGPQGGVYFITPSGTRSYLPRSETPPVRVQENCTSTSPALVRKALAYPGLRCSRAHLPTLGD